MAENFLPPTPNVERVRHSISRRRLAIARCKELAASYEDMCVVYDLYAEPRKQDLESFSVVSDSETVAYEECEPHYDHIRYVIPL